MEIKEKVHGVLRDELQPKIEKLEEDKQYTVSDVLDMGLVLTKDYEVAGRDRLYQMIRNNQLSFRDISVEGSSRSEYVIDGDILAHELRKIYNL